MADASNIEAPEQNKMFFLDSCLKIFASVVQNWCIFEAKIRDIASLIYKKQLETW